MTTPSSRRALRIGAWAFPLGALALGLLSGAATGIEMPVDTERQGSMFKRIFTYDKHLRGSDKIVVIVVSPAKDGSDVQEVASVFRSKGLFPAVVTAADLTDDLTATLTPESAVVYAMSGVDYAAVKEFTARKGFLSISGSPSLVEQGHVSVGVDLEGDRTQILVNMSRLETEGHELSSELLNIARVIR